MVAPFLFYLTFFENDDSIGVGDIVEGVGYEQHGFVLEKTFDGHRKEKSAHVCIDCTQDVVEYVDVCIAVKSPGQGQTGSLTP
jgi:hypothetical protein